MRIDCTELFEAYNKYLKDNEYYKEQIIETYIFVKGERILEKKETRTYLEDNEENFKKFCKETGIIFEYYYHRNIEVIS